MAAERGGNEMTILTMPWIYYSTDIDVAFHYSVIERLILDGA